jgi:O-methyltransferase involved in polyketide biosynthesis
VQWTNLVTLYLRAYESRSRRPVLGDHAAAEAVDRIDYDFKRIHRTSLPATNQYLVTLRAKQLDDWCADYLRRQPDAVVLHLGCGLDGRAVRRTPPSSVLWFDLDQPGVIELRRRLYEDTEQYRMIGSSVTDPGWLDQIPTGRPTLVVAEGLLASATPATWKRGTPDCASSNGRRSWPATKRSNARRSDGSTSWG